MKKCRVLIPKCLSFLTKYYLKNKIKKNEMGGACSMNRKERGFCCGTPKERTTGFVGQRRESVRLLCIRGTKLLAEKLLFSEEGLCVF
jgi:hypothetical protein